MRPTDHAIDPYKIYKDTDTEKLVDRKATTKGYEVSAQDDTFGNFTKTNYGDEQGWVYLSAEESSREDDEGVWAQAVPCSIDASTGELKPISDKTFALDSTFASKTLSALATSGTETFQNLADYSGNNEVGILVAAPNHEGHQYFFLPAGGGKIKVDNLSSLAKSTKVYDVKSDGTLDTANIGQTKDLWFVESNFVSMKTTAKFRLDTTKNGELNFQNETIPALATPETPENYRVKCAWNGSKWDWYAIAEATATSSYYARIRWNYTETNGDLSEGELMNFNGSTGVFTATATPIWIDTLRSSDVKFDTCGDDTYFRLKKLATGVTRNDDVVRDLYYADFCMTDGGKKITHLEKIAKVTTNTTDVEGYLLSDELSATYYTGTTARIKTTILSVALENICIGRMPTEWTNASGCEYLEMNLFDRGIRFFCRPIRPVRNTLETETFDSAIEVTGTTIATYIRS